MHTFCKYTAIPFFLFAILTFPALVLAGPEPPAERQSSRIVGGYEATKGAWPWIAALVSSGSTPAAGQYCAGSLIHPNWVITAGHCVEGSTASQIEVYMGLHDLRDTEGIEQISVSRIIAHPEYGYIGYGYPNNDIALLELENSSGFETISLVSQGDPQDFTAVGVNSTVIGWGALTEGGTTPYELQEVVVPIESQQDAIDAYGAFSVTGAMIAAGYPEGGKDACQGDSGGPLMMPGDGSQSWVLGGLVSWGDGCARPDTPGMYTRVSEFYDWVGEYVPLNYANKGHIPSINYILLMPTP